MTHFHRYEATLDPNYERCANARFGGCEAPVRAVTSVRALQSVTPGRRARVQADILSFLARVGDSTCDEYEAATQTIHQTASAGFNALMREGVIKSSGRQRKTRTGRMAIVWVIKEGTM